MRSLLVLPIATALILTYGQSPVQTSVPPKETIDCITSDQTSQDLTYDYDFVIQNGTVIDGTGRERFKSDVAIRAGKIAAIGDLANARARKTINAAGLIVSPGFIDLHSHADTGLVHQDPTRRAAPNLVSQGITTVVINQDGGGPLDLLNQRNSMEELRIGINAIQLLRHGSLRRSILGDDYERPVTAEEISQMKDVLRQALEEGAYGLSAGLEYVPGRWSTPAELEQLAEVVAEFDGVYVVHERSSGSTPMWYLPSRDAPNQPSMMDNLRELVLIADSTGVTTVATHIKARGTDFWGSADAMNEVINHARESGLSIFADQYPYNTSGSDGSIVLIPSWVFESTAADDANQDSPNDQPDFADRLERVLDDSSHASDARRDIEFEIGRRGGAEHILIVDHPNKQLVGKSLSEFAESIGASPTEAAVALQLTADRTRRGGARLRAFSMSEKDVESFASQPWTATSSDAGITLPEDGPVHPRFYGAFPRKIRHYAIERKVVSIEEAIRSSTWLPAQILNLENRGIIREDAVADLVVFDPDAIRDKSDAFDPHQFSEGIPFVFVNGELAVEDGERLGTLNGEVLQR